MTGATADPQVDSASAGTAAAVGGVIPGVQRHGSGGRAASPFRITGRVLVVAHLLLVGWHSLRPLAVYWVTPANLRPLATIRADLALAPMEAAAHLGAGLLLLAPLGVLLPMATGRLAGSSWLGSLVHTVFTGAMVSLAIEVLQTYVPGRTLDVDSLLLNTAGVALAHLLLVPVIRVLLRRREPGARPASARGEEGRRGSTPTNSRVGLAPKTDALPASRT